MSEPPSIRAAGGVVWRRDPAGRVEVAVVHRPRYDDWSLPKGKLDAGETDEEAALREVEEETGLRCTLDEELGVVHYRDRKGRPKQVRYWSMQPIDPHAEAFVPNHEVDECRWVALETARGVLTYVHDRELVDRLPS